MNFLRLRLRRGVSVIEILVSMVLLSVGIVLALSAMTYATKVTASTTQSTLAGAFARKLLEIALSDGGRAAVHNGKINPVYQQSDFVPLYHGDQFLAPYRLEDFLLVREGEQAEEFLRLARDYQVKVSVAPWTDPVVPSASLPGLYHLEVQLRWRDRLGLRTLVYPAFFREE